jgi:hypothetical protein
MSSLILITSYRRSLALRLTCHTGLSLLFEVGVRPPHDGMRRIGRRGIPRLSGMRENLSAVPAGSLLEFLPWLMLL